MVGAPFDVDYVSRLRKGDRDAQEHFAAYFEPVVRSWLKRRVRSEPLRQDIAQDTFARIFSFLRSGGRIEYPERMVSFVTGVARNTLLEKFREGRTQAGPLPVEPALPDERAPADDQLIRRERARHVHAVLSSLSERDREVLRKLFLEDVHRDDVCAEMGIGRGYLRVLVHRAVNNFRISMKRFGSVPH